MPAFKAKSPWQEHRDKWKNCTLCPLHQVRHNIVLAKGKLPCEVLFIGEAPGASEDATGIPFVGPAGHLLEDQIREAIENSGRTELRLGFTNLVCCIPKEDGRKTGEPSKESIITCSRRLDEFIAFVAKPRAIVAVGDLPAKYLLDELVDVKITHPARILRMKQDNPVRVSLEYNKCVVILENLFREV